MSIPTDVRRYSPSDLEVHLLDLPPETTRAVDFGQDGAAVAETLPARVRDRLPGWVLVAIEHGPGAYEPPPRPDGSPRDASPSGADSAVCYYLARAGLTDAQIRAVYKSFPIGNGKYSRQGRGDGYLAKTLSNMRERLSEENAGRLVGKEKNGRKLLGKAGVLLSEVEAEEIEWLWRRWLALRKLILVDGDPGLGKSALTLDLAARVSAGLGFPDGAPCEPGGVVLISAEDGLADTVRPRLDAAGADASRILALTTVPDEEGNERLLSIPENLPFVERGIERVGARLVVVDPLMAFLSSEVNSHKDQDVRKALAPLAALAERTGAAVVVVRHLNKASGGNVLYRGGGSIGIIGAARSAFLVAKDPEDENRRVLAPMKSNLVKPAGSLVFTLESADNGAVRVVWRGDTDLDASRLLATSAAKEEGDALSEATEFLREMLAHGPVPARQVKDEAEDIGISEKTLKRAKKALGISTCRENEPGGSRGAGKWLWEMPRLGLKPQNDSDLQGGQGPEPDPLEGRRYEQDESHRGEPNFQEGQASGLQRGGRRSAPLERSGEHEFYEESEPADVDSTLATLLGDRPDWLRNQARKCLEEGGTERLLKPLAASIAAEYLGDVHRGREAMPFVRERLEDLARTVR